MTTGTGPDARGGPRGRAAARLGVASDAGPAEVRTAYLRLLGREDFAPPAPCRRAWRLLTGTGPGTPDPDAVREEEQSLAVEVEAFAGRFWSLAPGERREQWAELSARCSAAPGPRARLRQLEAGLAVPAAAADGLAGELAAAVQEIFVLGPEGRAATRQALRRRARENPQDWEAAARSLRQEHPELAALQPELVTALADWEQRRQHLERMRRRLKSRPKVASAAGKRAIPWFWIVVALIVSGVGRALLSDVSNHKPANPVVWPADGPGGSRAVTDPNRQPIDLGSPEWRKTIQDAIRKAREDAERKRREAGVDGEGHPGGPGAPEAPHPPGPPAPTDHAAPPAKGPP